MATDPTPAQSDETRDAELAKQWVDAESPYIAHDTVKQLLAADRQRIFDAVEGAIDAKIDNQGQIQILTGDALEGYLYGIQVLRAELRAAIKRLREGI